VTSVFFCILELFLACLTSIWLEIPERIKFPGWPRCVWVYEKSRSSVVLKNRLKYLCCWQICDCDLVNPAYPLCYAWPRGVFVTRGELWAVSRLLLGDQQAHKVVSRPPGSLVCWERLGWERSLVGEGMGVRVDKSKYSRGTSAKSHHIEHHHMSQKFTNSWTRCTKRATCVFATAAASWISTTETKSHPLGLV